MFEAEIKQYDSLVGEYQRLIGSRVHPDDLREHHEILFSAHSCAIEGNSFTVGDTQELKTKGLGLIPQGKSLFEAFEILDHFKAYEYLMNNLDKPLSENLLKETHRILMLNTLSYKVKDAVAGEYTDTDMCAGETTFGNHEDLIAKVPQLMESTQHAIDSGNIHPMILAAKFHGFYEYLHPFRDGNGRIGRLFSNFILAKMNQPPIIINSAARGEYISCMNAIRTEGTDEYLIAFFFKQASEWLSNEIQNKKNINTTSRKLMFLF